MSAQDAIAAFAAISVFLIGYLTWRLQKRSNKSTEVVQQLQERNEMIADVQEERNHLAQEVQQFRITLAEAQRNEQNAYAQLATSRAETLQTRADSLDAQAQLHTALITIDTQLGRITTMEEELARIKRGSQPA